MKLVPMQSILQNDGYKNLKVVCGLWERSYQTEIIVSIFLCVLVCVLVYFCVCVSLFLCVSVCVRIFLCVCVSIFLCVYVSAEKKVCQSKKKKKLHKTLTLKKAVSICTWSEQNPPLKCE